MFFTNTVMINWRNIPRKEYHKMNVHDFMEVIDVCVFDLVCQEKRWVSRLKYYQNYQKAGGLPRVRIIPGANRNLLDLVRKGLFRKDLCTSRRQLQYKIREYHIPSRCNYDNK